MKKADSQDHQFDVHTRSMVYKKHRQIWHSPVSYFFSKNVIGLLLIFGQIVSYFFEKIP